MEVVVVVVGGEGFFQIGVCLCMIIGSCVVRRCKRRRERLFGIIFDSTVCLYGFEVDSPAFGFFA